jgi:SAM-dependent methyltransferase
MERGVNAPATAPIETANPEQVAAWNGNEGEHWAANADRFESIGDAYWQRLLHHVPVGVAADVLDVGCGTGKSTRDLGQAAPDGAVVGVDLSAPMLTVARARAAVAGLTNVTYLQADAQIHPFEPVRFDTVVSCFGAMFFADPIAAFTNLGRAMRPGAALALLAWRELDRNEWLTAIRGALAVGRELPAPPPDTPSPFALADRARVHTILAGAGFDDIELHPVEEPLTFGVNAADAYDFLRTMGIVDWLTRDLDAPSRSRALEQLRATVEAHEHDGEVSFKSSAWLVTARASTPDDA